MVLEIVVIHSSFVKHKCISFVPSSAKNSIGKQNSFPKLLNSILNRNHFSFIFEFSEDRHDVEDITTTSTTIRQVVNDNGDVVEEIRTTTTDELSRL